MAGHNARLARPVQTAISNVALIVSRDVSNDSLHAQIERRKLVIHDVIYLFVFIYYFY